MKRLLDYLKHCSKPRLHEYLFDAESRQHANSAGQTNDPGKARHVMTDIGGKKYKIESDDDYLEHIGGVFEPHMVGLFDTLIKPSHTVLDIGANIGCTAILFGSRAKRVISFESSPSTFKFLERNVRASGLDNIQLENLGLGKSEGRLELTFAANNRAGGFVSNKMQASDGHQIESIEIVQGNAFIKESNIGGIDFIKIDVEGFERDVIEGLSEIIRASRPVVTLELNHWCLNVFQRISVPDFFDFLRGVFPYLYAVGAHDVCNLHDPGDSYHVMFRHVAGGLEYQNIVGAFDLNQLERFNAKFKGRGQV